MEMYEEDVMSIDDYVTAESGVWITQQHDHERSTGLGPDNLIDASSTAGTKRKAQNGPEEDGAIYGASRFGHFGEYMRRKRAKLQIQNASMDTEASGEGKSSIFKGISVYVRLRILRYVTDK